MKYIIKFFTFFLLIFSFYTSIASYLLANTITSPISLNSSQVPWRSIGVLYINNKKCTAVVVGSNIILTSAYCLLDKNGNKLNSTQNLLFKAGYKNGFYLTQTTISSFLIPQTIFPPNNLNDTQNSWAFLFTTKNIANITGSIKIYKEPITTQYLKEHKILTVGYTENENEGLLASIKCKFNNSGIEINDNSFVNTESAPILLQSCMDYFHPLIGSPVFSIDKDNNISIIGIISAKLTKNNKNNNISIPESLNVVIPMSSLNKNINNLIPQKNVEYNNKELEDTLNNQLSLE